MKVMTAVFYAAIFGYDEVRYTHIQRDDMNVFTLNVLISVCIILPLPFHQFLSSIDNKQFYILAALPGDSTRNSCDPPGAFVLMRYTIGSLHMLFYLEKKTGFTVLFLCLTSCLLSAA